MQIILAATISLAIIIVGALIVTLSLRSFRTEEVSERVKEYMEEGRRRQPQQSVDTISLQRFNIVGTFPERVILPVFRRIGQFLLRFTPAEFSANIERQLVIANNPLGLGTREFFGIQLISAIAGVALLFVLIQNELSLPFLALGVLSMVLITMLPIVWLRSTVRNRQNRLLRGLPDAIDMLSVCATAGLGFDQSLQRVSEHWQTPIGVEFGRVVSEMEMGFSRRESLRNMADRFDIPELSGFIAVLIQSEQLGMSISDTLHAQAAQMREERRFRAQEEARKIPTKMLFPLALLIFPAMMAVILGPAIPQLLTFMGNFSGG